MPTYKKFYRPKTPSSIFYPAKRHLSYPFLIKILCLLLLPFQEIMTSNTEHNPHLRRKAYPSSFLACLEVKHLDMMNNLVFLQRTESIIVKHK